MNLVERFDGDEMNIFLPQSNQTKIELEEIADVQRQVITPALSVPIIGIVQDGLLGAYTLTQPTMKIDWKSAMNIISYTSIDDFSSFKKNQDMQGTDLFSLIIPARINAGGNLEVKNGKITKGFLGATDKGGHSLGAKKPHNLVHLIWDEYGFEETRKFLDNTQRLINNFNLWNGFSVGIGDIDIPKEVEEQLHKLFETKKLEVDHLITEMENNPDLIPIDVFEDTIKAELDAVRSNASKLILENLKIGNNFKRMINAGSKGNPDNIGQMGGCIGQQAVENKRIRKNFNGRSLPYCHQHDDSALGRGFVEQPFFRGAHPRGFIFHNMASREGLIDTAIKTAESGYVQRKLIKSMEDISVKYDGTVRNSNNTIIQFIYGDSGIDTTKQSFFNLNILEMSNSDIATKIKFTDQELKNFKNFNSSDNDKYYYSVLELRNVIRNSRMILANDNITFENGFMIPVNIKNILNNVKNSDVNDNEKLEPSYVLEKLTDVIDYKNTKVTSMSEDEYNNKNSLKYKDEMLSKTVLKLALYEYLSPKICIFEHGINKAKFDKICENIITSFNRAVVEPGEMVGIIAAQSIGEPTTQMSSTKNTMVIVVDNTGNASYIEVGHFVDNLMNNNKDEVFEFGNGNLLMNLYKPEHEYYIVGVSNTEKTSWNKILQISKHPANGGLVKVHTKSGKTTTATLTHSFLKRTTNGITTAKGSDLKLGDRIPVAKYIPEISNSNTIAKIGEIEYKLDKLFGWVCGAYISDGSINKNTINISKILPEFEIKIREFVKRINADVTVRYYQGEYGPSKTTSFNDKDLAIFLEKNFGNGSYNKKMGSFVFASNKEFISGVLSGLFDGDGNINVDKQMIRYSSRSEKLISGICLLLAYNGIFASKSKEKTVNQPGKIQHTLCLQRKYAQQFKDTVGLYVQEKANNLDEIIKYNDRDNKHSDKEEIDMIPELGNIIASIGSLLKLHGQSRLYGRFAKKESIDRTTLQKYIKLFKEENEKSDNDYKRNTINDYIAILEQAANSDVIWDKIVKLEYLEDPKENVYDFTVPGNDSFMVDEGILVHNTLNTFHGAGSKSSVSLGVPRVKELLSLSRNIKTPIMNIYLINENRGNVEIANKIASHLKHTTIKDIRRKVDIYYDPNPLKKGGSMEKDNVYNIFYSHNPGKNTCQGDIMSLPWLLRIEMDREKMMEKDITLLDIKSKYCNNWERRYTDVKGLKKEERLLLERIVQTSILSNSDNDSNPVIHIRFDMTEFDFAILVSFIDTFVDNFKLKGIENIDKINGVNEEPVISFDNENEELKKEKQHVIYTGGVNLNDVRYLNGIDLNKTITNDIMIIYATYGIDAARAALIKEFKSVFAGAGNKVNFAHLETLCDLITNSGIPTSIDRHGMNKSETDPLARASFEKTVDQLLTAAVFGEIDHMNNVSSRIMAGLAIKGGTGLCDIILNSELLEKSEYIEDIEQKYVKTYNEVSKSSVMNDLMTKEISGIFIPE